MSKTWKGVSKTWKDVSKTWKDVSKTWKDVSKNLIFSCKARSSGSKKAQKKAKSKSKKFRVEEEKVRQLGLLKNKLPVEDSTSGSESSVSLDSNFTMKLLKKKMSRKQSSRRLKFLS